MSKRKTQLKIADSTINICAKSLFLNHSKKPSNHLMGGMVYPRPQRKGNGFDNKAVGGFQGGIPLWSQDA